MIDRSRRVYPLRTRTLLWASGISFAACALLPLMAAICLLAGWIAFGAIWLVILGSALVAFVGIGGGILALFFGSGDQTKGGGCLGIFAGFIASGLYSAIKDSWAGYARASVNYCASGGSYLFVDLFGGYEVWFWSWIVMAASLATAVTLLATIGLLRCEGMAKYSLLRIGYTCPRCHQQKTPHFRCSKCAALIPDLAPTTYGILRAACGNCGQGLATTDLFGRLKLDKVCSRKACSADLNDPALGHIGEFHLAIVGAASSGKTNLMVTSVWRLERAFANDNGLTLAFADPSEEVAYRARIGRLQKGEVLDKTSDVRTFNLTLTRARGQSCRLYLYDAAGEDFAEEDRLGRHVFHRFVDGIIFIVDPFAESDIRWGGPGRLDPDALRQINPAAQEASEILARLINSLESTLGIRAGGLFPIPIAVALTKLDGLDPKTGPGEPIEVEGSYMSLRAASEDAFRRSGDVRQFLVNSGMSNFVGVLEARFPRVGYFGVSALGRLPDPSNHSPFKPRGVLAPLIWLCFHARAFSDSLSIQVVFSNAARIMNRSLRGLQGTRARVLAWLLLVGAGALVLCGLWYGFGRLTALHVS
jgi:hypothetical protein